MRVCGLTGTGVDRDDAISIAGGDGPGLEAVCTREVCRVTDNWIGAPPLPSPENWYVELKVAIPFGSMGRNARLAKGSRVCETENPACPPGTRQWPRLLMRTV